MVFRNPEIDKENFTPRAYQQDLLEKAMEKNIIVPLGTGTGKTYIAVMLIKELAEELRLGWTEGAKRSFFLVDKVALVRQQAEQIRQHSDLEVGEYHGGLNVDLWNEARWTMELRDHQVMVLTAQIFLDLLNHGFLSWTRIRCLVIDECHHAIGAHPYLLLMQRYKEFVKGTPKESWPRVLGLTASVVSESCRPEKLLGQIRQLETSLHADIETTSEMSNVAKYGAKPKVKLVVCHDFALSPNCAEADAVLDKALKFSSSAVFHRDLDIDPTKPFHESLKRVKVILNNLGPWAAWRVCELWEGQLRKLNQYNMTELQEMFICSALTYIRLTKQLLGPMSGVDSVEKLLKFVPDKVARLLDVLRQLNPAKRAKKVYALQELKTQGQHFRTGAKTDGKRGGDEFAGICFVEQRYVAYILKGLLRRVQAWDPENYGYLHLDFLIGVSGWNCAEEEGTALHRRQETVLRQFRTKDLNLLIATAVLEEGVDVRHCNLVLRFDEPKDYRSYVQSRGRARKENSLYIILIEQARKQEYVKKLENFAKIEAILEAHSESRGNPPPEPLAEEEITAAEAMSGAEPYVVPATGPDAAPASVSITTAIALVNRYCAKLPSDIFTKLVPRCDVEEINHPILGTLYQAKLVLPINSPVKETLEGIPMKNKKLAQMSVALKVCAELHRRGELDDHLLPVGKESVARLLNELEDDGELWPTDGRARPGSIKRKQYYDRKSPAAFLDSLPRVGEKCFLHRVHFRLEVPASGLGNPKNRRQPDPAEAPQSLGLLSRKRIPMVPSFPLFARQGKVSAAVESSEVEMELTPELFELVTQFHRFLFSDILCLEKLSMGFGPNHDHGFFIVPLTRVDAVVSVLDLVFLKTVVGQIDNIPKKPGEVERRDFIFKPERYVDAIVMPWYRDNEAPHCFFVADVRYDKKPSTAFPDDKFPDFNAYFDDKYKLAIYNQDQPLLDVDYTTSRLNLLLPRNLNRRGVVLKGREERRPGPRDNRQENSSQMQLLIPELVDVHPVAATLWNQVVLLPSFIYRLHYLLLADELRLVVQHEAFGVAPEEMPADLKWATMDYGWSKSAPLRVTGRPAPVPQSAAEAEDFEIGTWDPSEGDGLSWDLPPLGLATGPVLLNGDNGIRGDVVGDPLASHSDEEDEDVLISTDFSRQFMGGRKVAALEPRADITPLGWDEPGGSELDDQGGLTLISAPDALIDKSGLTQDIAGDESVLAGATDDGAASAKERSESILARAQRLSELEADVERRAEEESLDDLMPDGSFDLVTEEALSMVKLSMEVVEEGSSEVVGAEEAETLLRSQGPSPPKQRRGEIRHLAGSRGNGTTKEPSAEVASKPYPSPVKPITKATPKPTAPTGERASLELEEDLRSELPQGPSPALILQALTLSAANDGINLERLETVGDSFLKYATTVYLFNTAEGRDMHEGKLSFMRSKQVSNYYLYRLAKRKGLGSLLVATKLEPQDNWLPPAYVPTADLAPNDGDPDRDDDDMENALEGEEVEVAEAKERTGWDGDLDESPDGAADDENIQSINISRAEEAARQSAVEPLIPPYNILSQQSIADKAMADAVEALIGVYLLTYGPMGALHFMAWLGLRVQTEAPVLPDPLLRYIPEPEKQLEHFWRMKNLGHVEEILGYKFTQKAYLVQAFTHASYYHNRITDCYQRLEFLGDAVLDYAITRYLYEDERLHNPGVLTDLRSALVNNTIFASLAVKYGLHKYFMAVCPQLHFVIDKFVKLYQQKQMEANFDEELYFLGEDEVDEEEDVEVPKCLGDIFESLAGAIYLDSGCSIMAVWRVYKALMADQLERCLANPPKSPIRELLELEPEKTKFSKLERIVKEGKIRVTVDVGDRRFIGMGRNYRIAKSTAAKRALRTLKEERAIAAAAAAKK